MTENPAPAPGECFCVCCEEVKRGFYQQHFERKSDAVRHFLADQQRRRDDGCMLASPEIFPTSTIKSTKILEQVNRTLVAIERRAQEEPPNFSDD